MTISVHRVRKRSYECGGGVHLEVVKVAKIYLKTSCLVSNISCLVLYASYTPRKRNYLHKTPPFIRALHFSQSKHILH